MKTQGKNYMIKKRGAKTILLLTILFLTITLAFTLSPIQNIASATTCTTDAECKKGEACKIEEGETKGECVRALEIVYPQIPGVTTPKVISTGLPEYIKYIFYFSIWLIGFVILGALIYSGFQYFTSFGNPEKFSAAKNGIISAFLGGIILLGAVLIFNTINPQLVILEAPPLDVLEPTVRSGIYLCNYNVDEVVGVLSLIEDYTNNDENEEERTRKRLEATEELGRVMKNDKGHCLRVPNSIRGLGFEFEPWRKKQTYHSIFQIPREDYVNNEWVYDYGIIFHEKDNFQGACQIWNKERIYKKIGLFHPELGFNARSVTLFKKPDAPPREGGKGVILYQCLDYNDVSFCPEGVVGPGQPFPPGNNIRSVTTKELGKLAGGTKTTSSKMQTGWSGGTTTYETTGDKTAGARSIKIDPVGVYFAILFDKEDFTADKTCEVISNDDPNLLDNEIGRCGADCQIVSKNETKDWQNKNCYPCLQSMFVIKGKIW